MKRSFAYVIVLVIVIVAVGFWLWSQKRPTGPLSSEPVNRVVDIDPAVLPEGFPADVPLEQDAKVVSNYTATSPYGEVQSSRTFESVKSIKENFDLYKAFIKDKKNGWTYLNEVNDPFDPDHKAIFAQNAQGTLSVNISSKADGGSIVDLSFVANK